MTTLDDIDRSLDQLCTGNDELGNLLLELELDGDRQLLDGASLTGATAERWAAAAADLLRAWQAHAELDAALQRARGLRGSRRRVSADSLVELEVLLAGRPAELASTVAAVTDAAAVVRTAGAAWVAMTPRLTAAGVALQAAGIEGPVAEYERLTTMLAGDPLSIEAAAVDALGHAIEAAQQQFAEIERMREEGGARLAAARALMDQVEEAQRDGETAHASVIEKIVNADAPAPRRSLSDLDAGLRGVEQLLEQQDWRAARDALSAWTTNATRELERALAVAAENRAPLERRNQLRGLLGAYQAKAGALRALEAPAIEDLFEQAQDALYGGRTDLEGAAERVARYGRAIAGHAAESKGLP
jgi:hypothetical protein